MNSSRICGVTLCVVLWGAFAIVGQALADGFERGVVNGEAVADDAMTAATNPAGMAFLDRTQLLAAALVASEFIQFKSDGNNTASGGDGGEAGKPFAPGAGLFFVYKANPDLGLGLSFTSPFGGGASYDDSWSGRFIVQNVEFLALGLNLSAGYKVNDWLAVGGGVSALYASFVQDMAVNFGAFGEGRAELDTDDVKPGFNLGVLIRPTPQTKVGITYRSEVTFELNGSADITLPIGAAQRSVNLDTDLPTPQRVLVSVFHALSPKLAVTADFGWSNFSSFDRTVIDTGTTSNIIINRNWKDTWRLGLGAMYRLNPKWGLQAGMTYSTSPVSDSDRTPDLPIDRQIHLTAGAAYQWSDSLKIGFGYEYLHLGDANINFTAPSGAVLSGDYDTNEVHVVRVLAIYKY